MNGIELGWSAVFEQALVGLEDPALQPARVVCAEREHYRVIARDGATYEGEPTGKLRHRAGPGELPVVGDWVAARLLAGEGRAAIEACLPRKSVLQRKRPDRASEAQLIAATVAML